MLHEVEYVKRQSMIDSNYAYLSVRKQCELLSVPRSNYYHEPSGSYDVIISNHILDIYTKNPVYGYRKVTAMLRIEGVLVNSKKVLRLMRLMNLQAIYRKPNTSRKEPTSFVYRYLLGNIDIVRANQVVQVDITYLRTDSGFVYLIAFIDVYSRFVLSWRLSNSLDSDNCLLALEDLILKSGAPEIINSDQGSQFTSDDWIKCLQKYEIKISMTGRGRCLDNIYIERLWKSFKYEGSFLYEWRTIKDLKINIPKWIYWYNYERPHQSLKYKRPAEIYCGFMDKSKDFSTITQYQEQLQV